MHSTLPKHATRNYQHMFVLTLPFLDDAISSTTLCCKSNLYCGELCLVESDEQRNMIGDDCCLCVARVILENMAYLFDLLLVINIPL